MELQKNVFLGYNVIIYGPALIGENTYIGENSVIGYPPRNLLKKMIKENDDFCKENLKTVIGRNVIIRPGSCIYAGTTIEDDVETGHNIMIRENTIIGKKTLIGTGTIIDGFSTIGSSISIQSGVYIPANVVIEDKAFLGPFCVLTNDKYLMRKEYELKGPVIKNGASIGANVTILPGLVIKKGSIIGAGSVLTKDTTELTIFVGNPAKKLKKVPKDLIVPNTRTIS